MAKAASSRYCARSRRRRPATALHGLDLGGPADARDRVAHVDRGPEAGVEEVGLEEDLAVGDRDDVRRDVGRDVSGLGLDDGEGGEAAAAVLLVELGRALQESAVEVEDVARVRLAAGRAPQEERDLAVGRGLLGEVVVDAEGVLALVAEELADRAARVGGDVEEGRRLGGGGRHHDGVLHGPVLLEGADHLGHGRVLLADGHVDADDALALLVDDRVHRHRGLAGLAVADDELALAAADRHHAVDRLDAGLERLLDGLPVDDPGGDALDGVRTAWSRSCPCRRWAGPARSPPGPPSPRPRGPT